MIEKTFLDLPDLASLDEAAAALAQQIPAASWVYLHGDLGVGKTTFSQRFIHHKGCNERVTSPTYALMQDYATDSGSVIHCDLYRLADPEELYEIGLLELADSSEAVVLVEWPNKGRGVLPSADFILEFVITDNQTAARRLTLTQKHP